MASAKLNIGDEITAIIDGVEDQDGNQMVVPARVIYSGRTLPGDFRMRATDRDLMDYLNDAEEGVMWLRGHGEDVEAMLRAAHTLAERIPLERPQKNETPRLARASWTFVMP